MKKPLVLYHHAGLGDHMICHGLVRYHAEFRPVFLLCQVDNLATVRFMFSDTPMITVLPIADDTEGQARCLAYRNHGMEVMKLGYLDQDPTFSDVDYDKHFFRQALCDFDKRWSNFRVPRSASPITFPPACRVFIHEDQRFKVDTSRIPTLALIPKQVIDRRSANLFDWIPALENASEIHCIPSSVYLMIDSLPEFPSHIPLYCHRYSRPGVTYPEVRRKWINLD